MRPTRVEVQVSHFAHNLRFVRGRIPTGVKIMAIVKANAYGHGLEIIAEEAIASGDVHAFGVATEEEGVRLRAITSLPILVLTSVLPEGIDALLAHSLDFTMTDATMVHAIASRARALGKIARVHLKVDTGMRRIGVRPADTLEILRAIAQESDTIELVGLCTHFATSDEREHSFFQKQLSEFSGVVAVVKDAGIHVPLIHAANSGAILQFPKESAFDMVRPGIILYGYTPSDELDGEFGPLLEPALQLVSAVAFKKRVEKGDGVSYNLRWHAPKETTVLTVPIGYGDGYPRILSNRAEVTIAKKNYPIVGTICMDQLMIDVGDDPIEIGDKVKFIGSDRNAITAWTLARMAGTIPYEILTNIAARVPRIATRTS